MVRLALILLLLASPLAAQLTGSVVMGGEVNQEAGAGDPTFYSDDFEDADRSNWTDVGSAPPTHDGAAWLATTSTGAFRSVDIINDDVGSVDQCVKQFFNRVDGADGNKRAGAVLRNTTGDSSYYAVFCDNVFNNCKLESYDSSDSFLAGTNDTCSSLSFNMADVYFIACVDGTESGSDTRVALYWDTTDQDATWNEPNLDNWGDPQCCWQEGGGTIGSKGCNNISPGQGSWIAGGADHDDSGTYAGLLGWGTAGSSEDEQDNFVTGTSADFNFP